MSDTTVTIFICAVVLSFYGPSLRETATRTIGLDPYTVGSAADKVWSRGPPESLCIVANMVNISPSKYIHGQY